MLKAEVYMMKSAPVLFCLLLLFSLTGFAHAQHIREVIFICQEHDEPPTQEGRPKYAELQLRDGYFVGKKRISNKEQGISIFEVDL